MILFDIFVINPVKSLREWQKCNVLNFSLKYSWKVVSQTYWAKFLILIQLHWSSLFHVCLTYIHVTTHTHTHTHSLVRAGASTRMLFFCVWPLAQYRQVKRGSLGALTMSQLMKRQLEHQSSAPHNISTWETGQSLLDFLPWGGLCVRAVVTRLRKQHWLIGAIYPYRLFWCRLPSFGDISNS